ncbi:MAG TPA: hypothetical protein DCF44_01640 [Chitinophagaceae bacterium]|nr:hypothetical protein [Chitinophagaceae bacterium]
MDDEEKMHLRIKNPQILVRNCKFRTVDLSRVAKRRICEDRMCVVDEEHQQRWSNHSFKGQSLKD